MNNPACGLGDINAKIIFYIKNRPPLPYYQNLAHVKPLVSNEIAHICHETGNHWRKIFNVYAKVLFELSPHHFSSWQQLRDDALLKATSRHCLLFSAPQLFLPKLPKAEPSTAGTVTKIKHEKLHIILAKGYSEQLGINNHCTWLNNDFAINAQLGIIICPYFDYRQLSNQKISVLCNLIKQLAF